MKRFVLFVLCFVVALEAMAASGPDLAPYKPPGWSAPLICSMDPGATTPDYTLKKGVPVYVKVAVKNVGDERSPLGDYAIMVDGNVVRSPDAYVYLDPGEYYIYPTQQFTFNSTGTHTVTGMVDYDENVDELNEENNDFSANYKWVKPGPDLVPYKPPGWSSPCVCSTEEGDKIGGNDLEVGAPTYVSYAVKNVGNETASGISLAIFVDGVQVAGYFDLTENLGAGSYLTFNETFTIDSPGEHEVRYEVDYYNYVGEINEGNNSFTATYKWVEPAPDLVPYQPPGWSAPCVCSTVEGDKIGGNNLEAGVPTYVSYAVKNIGNETASGISLVIFVDGSQVASYFDLNEDLAAGSYLTFDASFTINSPGTHTVRYEVDYYNYVDEINEGNNSFSVTYEWLAEPEGQVDLYDEGGIVNISFAPHSFDDSPGDVNDPLGCVFVDNLFLAGFSPEQIEEGHFSYADDPEMNQYIKNILHDLGPCSLYVFIEGNIDGSKYTYSEAAKFDIMGDDYERLGSAQVWQNLEDYVYAKYLDLRGTREEIETNNWNFTVDLTFSYMGVYDGDLPSESGEGIRETYSSLQSPEFEGEVIAGTYSGIDLPESFDWRSKDGKDWMTPVKNQTYVFRNDDDGLFESRYCGCCYIMGVFGAVEAFYNIIVNNPDYNLDLSEQHFICENPGDLENPCARDFPTRVYIYLKTDGVVTEEDCPYVGSSSDCSNCDCYGERVKVTNYQAISRAGSLEDWRNTIKENLLETPLTFTVYYESYDDIKPYYVPYLEGIIPFFYGEPEEGEEEWEGHTVVLVGWGEDITDSEEIVPYWIVKNSVGPDWGDNGYMKIKMADEFENSLLKFYKPVLASPEFGTISVDQTSASEWHSVDFNHHFMHPIVVMGSPSYNDPEAVTIRVKDVTKDWFKFQEDGFKFQLDPWDLEEESHGTETISYVVMEKDVQDIEGGIWEAGSVSGVDHRWKTVNLKSGDFDGPPVVLTQAIKYSYASPIVTRIKDVTANSFKVKLQKQEYGQDLIAPPEEVHYIAIEPSCIELPNRKVVVSRGSDYLTHEWGDEEWSIENIESPKFIARIQSHNETDPCALRYKDLSKWDVSLKIEEEQSGDSEVVHVGEDFGYIVISGAPEAPSELNAEVFSGTKIHLEWIDNSEIEISFKIERKEDAGVFSFLKTVGANLTFADDEDVEPGKTYTYRIRAYNGTGYSAYSNEASATTPGGVEYEFNEISVAQTDKYQWHTVELSHNYTDPIVVMGPPSFEDFEPTTIRLKDVISSSFRFQIDEWDYLDGVHATTETISYMVMEEGVHDINGGVWEAGSILDVDHNWKTVTFESEDFDEAPVILAQTVTTNDASAVVTRIKDVTSNSFKIRLQEQKSDDGNVSPEDVHYIAIQPNQGDIDGRKFLAHKEPDCLYDYDFLAIWHDENWTGLVGTIESPVFIAGMQSCNDDDPCALRYRNLSESGVDVRVQEEKSVSGWHFHSLEDLGYLVISGVEPELSTFTTTETKEIYENYIKLASPVVTGNIVLNLSSNYNRKASLELIDVAGRVVKRKELDLRRGRKDLSLGQFKSGVYFLRIKSDEMDKHEVHKIMVLR